MRLRYWVVLLVVSVFVGHAPQARAADGEFDNAFGENGRITIDWLPGEVSPQAVALDANQRIVIAGEARSFGGVANFMLLRLRPNGDRDSGFAPSGNGFSRYDFNLNGIGAGGGNSVNAVRIQADGKILVAGCTSTGLGDSHFAALRVDDAGALDSSFGGTGAVHFSASFASMNCARDLLIRTDGSIVLGGYTAIPIAVDDDIGFRYYAATAVLSRGGQFDPGFLNGSISELRYQQDSDLSYGLALGATRSGGLFLAGFTHVADGADGAILRLDADGKVTVAFGNVGRQILGFTAAEVQAIQVLPSGGVMLAGASNEPGEGPLVFLARLTADGYPDPAFGVAGIARFPLAGLGRVGLLAASRNHGWLVEAADSGRKGIWLIRTDGNGNLDPAFGTAGILHAVFDPDAGTLFDATKAALQRDGKLVVAGQVSGNTAQGNDDFGVMRILADYDTLFVDGFDLHE